MKAYVDGRLLDADAARVPLQDRGHLLGDGIFETLRIDAGRVWQRERHRRRMQHGLTVLGLDIAMEDAFDAPLDALLADGDWSLRINVSAGDMHDIATATTPRVTALQRPLPRKATAGSRVVTTPHRVPGPSPLAGVKTLSMLPWMAARRYALRQGADDGLLLAGGDVVEASTSNLFALIDGTLHAPGPAQGAVDGVTRQVVLELLDRPHTGRLPAVDLDRVDEAWLTNTTGGITPVVCLDGRALPVGPVTRQAMDLLAAARSAGC